MEELEKLRAREILSVIKDLVRSESERPVTVCTMSGSRFSGALLDCRTIQGYGMTLLLKLSDSASSGDIAYIQAERIESLIVHDAASVLDVLSGGELAPVPTGPVPTKLALSRRIEELAKSMSSEMGSDFSWSVEWGSIPEGDTAMHNLSLLIEDAGHALGLIIKEYGADEIRKSGLNRARIAHAGKPELTLENGTIVISATLDSGPSGRMDRKVLKKALEAAL